MMHGRTVVLVSHHVQLCATGAEYVVALDNGRVIYSGGRESFLSSGVIRSLVQSGAAETEEEEKAPEIPTIEDEIKAEDEKSAVTYASTSSEASSSAVTASTAVTAKTAAAETKGEKKKAPRKLIDDEARAVGRISKDVWMTYINACGNIWYWALFVLALLLAAASPIVENGWLA